MSTKPSGRAAKITAVALGVVRLRAQDRANPADLSRISRRSPEGRVALGDAARLDRGEGPRVIEREDRLREKADPDAEVPAREALPGPTGGE